MPNDEPGTVHLLTPEPAPPVEGWTPPVIYDLQSDHYRAVTQADIDEMQRQLRALANFKRAVQMALTDTAEAVAGAAS